MDDYPSNSRRPVTPSENIEPDPGHPKLGKVVTGRVSQRKKPIGRRILDTFFSGESGVFNYLLNEVLVPALKDTARDMMNQGLDRAFYREGEAPPRSSMRHRGSSVPRTHISYDRQTSIVRPSSASQYNRREVARPSTFDLGEIVLESKIDAQVTVDALHDIVREYGQVTVAGLKDLIGMTSMYTDHKWGWTDLDEMTVRRHGSQYLLVLPEPEHLR